MLLRLWADALALKWHYKPFPNIIAWRKSTAGSQLTGKEVGEWTGTNNPRRKADKERLSMGYLWESSHLKENNSKEEHLFIMFLTLKAMWGHFWESRQMGVTHKSGECDKSEWIWIHIWTWTGSRLFYCQRLFKCALQWRKTAHVETKKYWLLCWMWNWCSLVSPIFVWCWCHLVFPALRCWRS